MAVLVIDDAGVKSLAAIPRMRRMGGSTVISGVTSYAFQELMRFLNTIRQLRQFRFSARLHWPWLTAGVVVCGAAWLYLVQLPGQRAEHKTAVAKVRMLEAQLRAQGVLVAAAPHNLPAQLATFDSLSLVTADLQALATQNGLLVSDATFKPAGDNPADARIGRVEVNARLKGGYLPLKKTLATLLATHQGLALESLSLRRVRSTDIAMDIDLRFTYFYRKPA